MLFRLQVSSDVNHQKNMERNVTTSKFIAVVVSICLLTFVLQHFAIYKLLIKPQLPSVKSVPLFWWGGYMLPIFLVSMLAGFWSKNLKEICLTSLLVAIVYSLFVYSLTLFHEPAYLKAYEGAFLPNFIKGTFIHFMIYFVFLLIGYGVRRFFVTCRNK